MKKNGFYLILVDFHPQPLPAQLDNFRKDSGTGSLKK